MLKNKIGKLIDSCHFRKFIMQQQAFSKFSCSEDAVSFGISIKISKPLAIEWKVFIDQKTVAIISYDAIFCGEPDKSIFILNNVFYTILRKPIIRIIILDVRFLAINRGK